MQRSLSILCATLLLGAYALPAHGDFLYSDFSSVDGLKLNGNASQVGDVLRLSSASSFSSGSTFTTNQVDLDGGNSFSTFFQFRIGNSGGLGDADGPGADGLVFVVQTVSNNVGAAGGGIGYSGINPSLGIEFDTYNNGPGYGDPDGNHVGIDLNGNIVSVQTQPEAVRFNNGEIWNAWVDYNGATDGLEVRWSLSDVRPSLPQLSITLDLVSILGQDTAFVGFTSATGSGFGNHDLLRWEFRGEFAPIGVPEPASIVMMSLGSIMVGWISRRRAKQTTRAT